MSASCRAFRRQSFFRGRPLGLKLGPYQIETPIGKGGMGSFTWPLDTRTDQHVAVKVLPPKRARRRSAA